MQPLRFEENLVTIPIGKAVNLVFDRWTIAGARSADSPREKRRPIEIGANNIMSAFVGARDSAENLRIDAPGRERTHGPDFLVRSLLFQTRPVDGPTIQPGRCASL